MREILLTILLLTGIATTSTAKDDLDRLDSVLALREVTMQQKESRIQDEKRKLTTVRMPQRRLEAYYRLYQLYYVYQFDSAMVYVDKGLKLATECNQQYFIDLNTLLKSELLSIGGLYSEARDLISTVVPETLEEYNRFRYYYIQHEIYSYWGAYSNDNVYGKHYGELSNEYLSKAVGMMNNGYDLYDYYMAEYCNYVKKDRRQAMGYYKNVLKGHPNDSRVYAMAAYALARKYNEAGDKELYKHFLTEAAISDIMNCTKENSALQRLAVLIFKSPDCDIERAEHYIKVAMDDAVFYHNRLRMLEISQQLPTIFNAYQQTLDKRNHNRTVALWLISLSFIALACSAMLIIRQNRLLNSRRKDLAVSNLKLQQLNTRLDAINSRLVDTNTHRENLVKLFIDISANYIDKLGKTQTLVKRKIKANQTAELLSMLSSSRITDEDADIFLSRFDKAFINHYPTFVDELNTLLDDSQPPLSLKGGRLTTELRIYALIRLGVSESSEIAALLFYSPQTIYNYRSAVKSRARNKDTFDNDVARLCSVINE